MPSRTLPRADVGPARPIVGTCRTTVYLGVTTRSQGEREELADAVNSGYGRYVTEPYPARAAVEAADLPIDIDVEIEVVALVE